MSWMGCSKGISVLSRDYKSIIIVIEGILCIRRELAQLTIRIALTFERNPETLFNSNDKYSYLRPL